MKEMMPINVDYVVFSSFALLAFAERNETRREETQLSM